MSFPLKVLLFLALETLLVTLVKEWSAGQYCLGIVSYKRSPFASPSDPQSEKPSYLVDPWLSAHERWWTVLFGVLAILDGAKSLARWTMWHAPLPFMGAQLSSEASMAVQVCVGVIEVMVGVAVLRLKKVALPLGLVVYGFLLVSTVLSWQLLPDWVEHYVVARRSFQGLSPRPGEIEFMQALVPMGTLFVAVVATGWLILIGRRAHHAGAA